MKILKLTFIGLAILLSSCTTTGESESNESAYIDLRKMDIDMLTAEIKKREAVLSNDSIQAGPVAAADLMEAYEVYAERFGDKTNAAEYLFKAGEIAMGLNHTTRALKTFETVYSDYKDYEKRPYALFLRAFILENQAQDYEQAKSLYEQFITEFPNHAMRDDAEYSIKNLGKTPEELIREFEIQDSIASAQKAA